MRRIRIFFYCVSLKSFGMDLSFVKKAEPKITIKFETLQITNNNKNKSTTIQFLDWHRNDRESIHRSSVAKRVNLRRRLKLKKKQNLFVTFFLCLAKTN